MDFVKQVCLNWFVLISIVVNNNWPYCPPPPASPSHLFSAEAHSLTWAGSAYSA